MILDRTHAFGDGLNLTGITDNLISARSESYLYTAANGLQKGVGIWGTLTAPRSPSERARQTHQAPWD